MTEKYKQKAYQEDDGNAQGDILGLHQNHGAYHAGETQYAANGKVYAAGNDDEGHAYCQHRVGGNLRENVKYVLLSEEVLGSKTHRNEEYGKQQQHGKLCFVADKGPL